MNAEDMATSALFNGSGRTWLRPATHIEDTANISVAQIDALHAYSFSYRKSWKCRPGIKWPCDPALLQPLCHIYGSSW